MPFISYAQNFEDVMLWRALQTVQQGFWIDVGAHLPDLDSVTKSFYDRGWRGINVEPSLDSFGRFQRERGRDINLNVALGSHPQDQRLYIFPSTGMSTLSEELARRYAGQGLHPIEQITQTMTLTEVCRLHAPGEIHFLKVDVEGTEREVLLGGDFSVYRPWIIVVEATVPGTRIPNHEHWEPILLQASYRFIWFDGLNRFYVSEDRYDQLKDAFVLPPNVFDDFTLYRDTLARPRPVSLGRSFGVVPAEADPIGRLGITAACRDADFIRKVAGAGTTRAEGDLRVHIMHNGLMLLAEMQEPGSAELVAVNRGHFQPQHESVFHQLLEYLPETARMLELGGSGGYFALWFLLGKAGRTATLVECNPRHRAEAETNASLNNLKLDCVLARVGAAAPPISSTSGPASSPHVSLANLLSIAETDKVTLLCCDVGGQELNFLEEAVDILRRRKVDWLFIATHAHPVTGDPLTHQRCIVLLQELGAVIEVDFDPHESFSREGLIVARFAPAPYDWCHVEPSIRRHGRAVWRDLAFDLAEHALEMPPHLIDRLVSSLYQALLLRSPDPAGLQSFRDYVIRDGDIANVLKDILGSDEFAVKVPTFLSVNDAYRRWPTYEFSNYVDDRGALACTGFRFQLTKHTLLGEEGDEILVPIDRSMLPHIFSQGQWQRENIEFIARHIKDKIYIGLDIGANIGLFSMQTLNGFPQISRMFCVEPENANFGALKFNLRRFSDDRVRAFNIALGSETQSAMLYLDKDNFGNYSLASDAMRDRPYGSSLVNVVSTALWMEENVDSSYPIIWKSDTQGYDEIIIAQTPLFIWEKVELAIVELWRIYKPDYDRHAFYTRIASFPHLQLGQNEGATADDVMAYLEGSDWMHDDLYLWR